jgi:hypothetical protein
MFGKEFVMNRFHLMIAAAMCALLLSGAARLSSAAEGEAYKLAEAPKDAKDVIATRTDAKDKEDVVVVGRVGGRANPWIKGVAAFSIVDRSLKPCNEIEGDTCTTPWDYCCESDLPKATVLVMFVDEDGKVVKQDARELLGVKELETVTIVGKAKRDKAGNVTVMASKVFVPTEKKE